MPRKVHDWTAVQAYHDEGHGFVECARKFGFTKSAWNRAIERHALNITARDDRRRKYDWAEVQAHCDAGASFKQCKVMFGFCNAAWFKAVQRGALAPRNVKKSVSEVLASRSSRWCKKAKLIREGVLESRCSECGIHDWRNKPLVIQIDHVNGNKDDWRLENLRMLCPNCHSQTETFSGRNLKRPGVARIGPTAVVLSLADDPG
jgi:Zn finger protein HypA/HybF involved in hydrogenase expression